MEYCSKEHQIADRGNHKKACDKVKRVQIVWDKYEKKESSCYSFATNFNDDSTLAGAFLQIKTHAAVSAAYEHLMDVFRRYLGDNLNARSNFPPWVSVLLIRLGRHQAAYDCLMWAFHGTGMIVPDYPIPDDTNHSIFVDPQIFSIVNADVFASVEGVCHRGMKDSILYVVLTLLKITILLDLKDLQNLTTSEPPLQPSAPPNFSLPAACSSSVKTYTSAQSSADTSSESTECLTQTSALLSDISLSDITSASSAGPIEDFIPRCGNVISGNEVIMKSKDHSVLIAKLEQQIKMLGKVVEMNNKFFWPALLEPGTHLRARPTGFMIGFPNEMQYCLQKTYDAWNETPGAIDMVAQKVHGWGFEIGDKISESAYIMSVVDGNSIPYPK